MIVVFVQIWEKEWYYGDYVAQNLIMDILETW